MQVGFVGSQVASSAGATMQVGLVVGSHAVLSVEQVESVEGSHTSEPVESLVVAGIKIGTKMSPASTAREIKSASPWTK